MTGLAAPLKIRAETPMRSRSRVARPTLTETWFYCSPSHPRCPLPLLGIRSSSSSPHPHLFPIYLFPFMFFTVAARTTSLNSITYSPSRPQHRRAAWHRSVAFFFGIKVDSVAHC
uniref:Uncharacterized protein n=1 Tax=Oryza barthii TaxID=65489 RepID=A0A0D3G0Q7_9ORYZ